MVRTSVIVGHEDQREELMDDLGSGNVAHAYLFAGPAHVGKMTVARWYAQKLLCGDLLGEERDVCMRSFENLTHSDLLSLDQLWIEDVMEDWDRIAQTSNVPQVHRSKKPAARTDSISIDDIRALQDRLHETGLGTFRCCIIRSVERMQDAAANAFLKILEEPPQGLIFLLTTSSLPSLLPTIISRARVMRFGRLSRKQMQPLLEDVEADDQEFIVHLAQGAPGIVETLKNDPDQLRAHRLTHGKALSFWKSSSLRERLQLLGPLKERGEEADQLLLHLGLALREQAPRLDQRQVAAFTELARGFESNAHRELLAQRFAMAL